MTGKAIKIFDLLDVIPDERFKIQDGTSKLLVNNEECIFHITDKLTLMDDNCNIYFDTFRLLLVGTYKIIKLPKKKKLRDLNKEEFQKWVKENCITNVLCKDCPFNNVKCGIMNNDRWVLHKDLYSDKFLDQEIEVD